MYSEMSPLGLNIVLGNVLCDKFNAQNMVCQLGESIKLFILWEQTCMARLSSAYVMFWLIDFSFVRIIKFRTYFLLNGNNSLYDRVD